MDSHKHSPVGREPHFRRQQRKLGPSAAARGRTLRLVVFSELQLSQASAGQFGLILKRSPSFPMHSGHGKGKISSRQAFNTSHSYSADEHLVDANQPANPRLQQDMDPTSAQNALSYAGKMSAQQWAKETAFVAHDQSVLGRISNCSQTTGVGRRRDTVLLVPRQGGEGEQGQRHVICPFGG